MDKSEIKRAFLCPADEFTPIPFWFWNDRLDEQEIARQIQEFYEKGVMGFVIHPRKGIPKDIPYLSDCFMHYVRFAVEEAAKRHMKVVLYDEAMYPSGSAHGMVVESNPDFASKCLRMEKKAYRQNNDIHPDCFMHNEKIIHSMVTDKQEILYFIEGFSEGTIRGIHEGEDDGEESAPRSADLLNPEAVETFINITHERYYEVLKEHFGKTVIAMFTDEPDILGRCHKEGVIPWTSGFLEFYLEHGGRMEDLPALWMEAGEQTETIRRNYRKVLNEKLRTVYYSRLSNWCVSHNIVLTGHPQNSYDIGMLNEFQIPGQDIVWRIVAPEHDKGIEGADTVMAKCSSDAARHRGYDRNANECFGCCGPDGVQWAFSMDDMKWYMDWLFVRGVNLLYPHAFYYSVDGEIRYGERPPDVGFQNIWWEYYGEISTYIKRLSWLMSGGYNTTPVAVLCEEDNLPWKIVRRLFQNQIEFNYLEMELLRSDKCRISNGNILIEKQKYKYLLVEDPALLTLDLKDKLALFVENGGDIILSSELNTDLLERDAVIMPSNKNLRVSHVVKDELHFYFMVNEGESRIKGEITVPVKGSAEVWDPWHGEINTAMLLTKTVETISVSISLDRRESLILCIDPKEKHPAETAKEKNKDADIPDKIIEVKNWRIRSDNKEINTKLIRCSEKGALESWTNWNGMRTVTGTVIYESEISGEIQGSSIWLDLGEVYELAHVYMNDQSCGSLFWAPYILEITDYIRPGQNLIRIEVTNTMANSKSDANRLSGLVGPVVIYCAEGQK